jgi:hypothetical protein
MLRHPRREPRLGRPVDRASPLGVGARRRRGNGDGDGIAPGRIETKRACQRRVVTRDEPGVIPARGSQYEEPGVRRTVIAPIRGSPIGRRSGT